MARFLTSKAGTSPVLTVLVAFLLLALLADISIQNRSHLSTLSGSIYLRIGDLRSWAGQGKSTDVREAAAGEGAPAPPLPPLLNPEDPIEATVWNYTATLRRAPPPGFEAWVKFAMERSCRLDLAAYRFIEEDLAPFRERPVTPEAVQASFRKIRYTAMVSVRDHQTAVIDDSGYQQYTGYFISHVQQYAAFLSDLDLIVNVLDNSRVYWPEPLPAELQQRLDAGQIDGVDAFREHGCHATPALEKWHDNYAFAISPTVDQTMVHELAPVVSFCKIAGCFADIRVPNHYSERHGGQCAPGGSADVPWSQKVAKVFWRGSNTGTMPNADKLTPDKIRKLHRNRLVAWARAQNSSLYDISFSGAYHIGEPYGDISVEMNGGALAEKASGQSAYQFKYLLVIDGNGQAGRLFGYLCSSSAVFLVEGMSEWYYQLLEPWVHYIPVSLDLSDLQKNVQWAIDHDEEVQAIVRRANEVMTRHTRADDQECYWYRMLLEFAPLNNVTKPAAPAAT